MIEEFPSPAEFHTERGDVYDLISPPAFIVLARALVATLSLGTVLLTCLLAQQVTHRSAAAFAMLLIAVCPAVVSRSSTVIVDTIAMFFTMLALYFCARLLRQDAERRGCAWRDTVLAGAAAGLAFVSKYPAGAVSMAVFLTFLLRDEIPLEKARRLLASAAAFFLASIVAMPALVLRPGAILAACQQLVRNYEKIRSRPGYLGEAISSTELGLPLLAAGVFGIFFCCGASAILARSR